MLGDSEQALGAGRRKVKLIPKGSLEGPVQGQMERDNCPDCTESRCTVLKVKKSRTRWRSLKK